MNMPRLYALLISIIGSIIIILGCSDKGVDNKPYVNPYVPNFQFNNYNIATDLDWSQRWYTAGFPVDEYNSYAHDDRGIPVSIYNNQYYYHPFLIAAYGIGCLISYRQTNDSSYLDRAYVFANKLTQLGNRFHGGIYMPYMLSASIHGSGDVLMTPWYSGFTQGYALSLYSRFYELFGDSRMKALADSVFTTFMYTDSSSNAWTCMIDSAGYYWIEEYPFHPPEHVFNGFMVGINGLDDYYLITHNVECSELMMGGLTTIAHYFDEWRNPGGISYYCLRHHHIPDLSYHLLVINLLRHMTQISGDSTFSIDADTLYSDYH
jgi:hypothetical protein